MDKVQKNHNLEDPMYINSFYSPLIEMWVNGAEWESIINEVEIGETTDQGGVTTTTTTTTSDSSSTTIIQNGQNSQGATGGKQDTSWVGSLNNWIQKVAAGFQSIYNGNSGKKDEASLTPPCLPARTAVYF